MASSETVDRLLEAIKANGSSNPYAFAVGYLGALVDEKALLLGVEVLEKETV